MLQPAGALVKSHQRPTTIWSPEVNQKGGTCANVGLHHEHPGVTCRKPSAGAEDTSTHVVCGVMRMSKGAISSLAAREQIGLADARRRAQRLAAKGDLTSAIRLLRRSLKGAKRAPDHRYRKAMVRTLIALGSYCVEAGLAQEGMGHLRQALKLDARNAEAYCALAHACEKCGLPDVAMELLQEAVRANPRSASAYKELASYHLAQERYEDAMCACRRALELDPAYEAGYVELALASEGKGDAAQGAAAWEGAVRLNPHNLHYHLGLARNLMLQGRLQASAQCLRQAVRIFPDSVEARSALAEICADLGNYAGTIKCATEIRARWPTNPVGYELLAVGYYQSGRLAEALAAVRHLIHLEPREAHHHLKLGVLLHQQGRLADAMEEYLRAAAMSSSVDDDTEHAAREAIANLDDVQVRQVLLRAAEDRVFRIKLARDPSRTLHDHGFYLSDEAMNALLSMELDELQTSDRDTPRVYH